MTEEQKPPYSQNLENDSVELFEYQKLGIQWLLRKRVSLLADEMGLGKSVQSILSTENKKRILIVCPAVARLHWLNEFNKFSNTSRDFAIVRTKKDSPSNSQSVIVSYELLRSFGEFDAIIIDEIHYAKNTGAQRTHDVFGAGKVSFKGKPPRKGILHEQKPSTKIIAISGTPAPNHAGELWPILYTFGKTSLNYDDFVQRFCVVSKRSFGQKVYTQITGTKRERIPELRQILNGIMLRRTKEEVGHMLPKVSYSTIVVEEGKVDLDIEASFVQYVFPKDRVSELEAKLKEEVDLVRRAINSKDIETLKGLAKSVSTLRRYIGIQKVEKTAELVAGELRSGLYKKIVIFAIHQAVIEGLRVRLKEFNPLTLYGGSKFNTAHSNIEKFQKYDKFQVFIGNIQACGIAINLTAAHNVLMVEQEWTPASNAQAIARCHRHGQTKPVMVRMVGLANSLDEKVAEILKRKTNELTELMDNAKSPDLELQELLS
jgi:SWI/SNF-related matrix-associated actin-dependent regulator 1 of chromatin subfamily A